MSLGSRQPFQSGAASRPEQADCEPRRRAPPRALEVAKTTAGADYGIAQLDLRQHAVKEHQSEQY